MPLELPDPHQPHLLSSADTLLLLRCDEATAGDAMVDAAGGGAFTDTGSVGVAGSLFASPAGNAGARTFDGATQRQQRAGTSAEAAALKLDAVTVDFWVNPGAVTGLQRVVGYGAAGETLATNYQIMVSLNGSEVEWFWEMGAGTNVTGVTTGAGLQVGTKAHVSVVRAPPASGTSGKCDVFVYVDARLVESWADQDLPTGGTSANWVVGANHGGGNEFAGTVDDIRISKFAASVECVRDSYARGVRDHDPSTLYSSGFYSVFARVLVEDGSGDFIDLTSVQGYDLFTSFEWTDDIDAQGVHGVVRLMRNVQGFSLSPLMVNSLLNVDAGGTALALGRQVKVETAVLPDGANILEAELYWQPVFHGFTVAIDYGSETIDLDVYDLHSELQDTWIEPDRTSSPPNDFQYGADPGVAIEGEVQDLIDDQEPSSGWSAPDGHQIYTPASPGWNVLPWNVPPTQHVAQHVETAIAEFGWHFKRRFDDHRKASRLTLYEPNRTGSWTSSDPTLRPEDIIEVRACKLDRSMIRNAIEVEYGDEADEDDTGTITRKTVLVDLNYGGAVGAIAAASEAKYGRRYARVGIASTRRINNATDAAAFGERMLRDLAEPKANYEVVCHHRPYIITDDFVKCLADDLHFDGDQVFAVTTAKHSVGPGATTTTLSLRSAGPAAFVKMWFAGFLIDAGHIFGDGLSAPQIPGGLTATATVAGLYLSWNFPTNHLNRRYLESEVHVSTSDGFTPSDSTIVRITRGRDAEVSALTPGTLYYVKVLHRDEMGNVSTSSTQVSAAPWHTTALPRFKAYDGTATPSLSGWTLYQADTEVYDVGSDYDHTVPEYVAPAAGLYRFHAHFKWGKATAARAAGVYLEDGFTNDEIGDRVLTSSPDNGYLYLDVSWDLVLTAGQVVTCWVSESSNRPFLSGTNADGAPQSYWSAELVADQT